MDILKVLVIKLFMSRILEKPILLGFCLNIEFPVFEIQKDQYENRITLYALGCARKATQRRIQMQIRLRSNCLIR